MLYQAGIKPLSIEVKVAADLNYRVDILLVPGLAIEVDGYPYHHSMANLQRAPRLAPMASA
jgi:hypothetical protein